MDELANRFAISRRAECLTQYLKYKAERGVNPYRADQDIEIKISDSVRIAIIGDWGTGERTAISLLEAVRDQKPNLLIHLGDVYYAGTEDEMDNNFLKICRDAMGSEFQLFTVWNHDMYPAAPPIMVYSIRLDNTLATSACGAKIGNCLLWTPVTGTKIRSPSRRI
jgi:ABC-type phosphate transport system ATPase subunit